MKLFKYLLIIFALSLVTELTNAQTTHTSVILSGTSLGKLTAPAWEEFSLMIMYPFDSLSLTLTPIKYESKYLAIQGDTVKAILYLLKQLEIKSNALYEAENVLSNIRTDGFVTNWKEFHKAVDRYKKVKDYNSVMQKTTK